MSSFESPGVWWLPKNRERRVSGVLRVNEAAGLELHLYSTLTEEAGFGEPLRYSCIEGSIHQSPFSSGTEVTFFDAFATSRSLRSSGTTAETIVANRCYVGDRHLGPDDEYAHFVAAFSGLHQWLGRTALHRAITADGHVQMEALDDVVWTVGLEDSTLEFISSVEFSYAGDSSTFRGTTDVDIRVASARKHDQVGQEILGPLRTFLTMATGEISRLESSSIVVSEVQPWSEMVHDLSVWEQARRQKVRHESYHRRPLIPAPTTQAELSTLLQKWWQVTKTHRRAVDLIFALLDAPARYVEVRFAMASMAMDLVVDQLGNGNERELLRSMGKPVTEKLGTIDDFVRRRRETRSRLWEERRAPGPELLALTEVTHWLLRFALLGQLNVDCHPERAPGFLHFAQQLRSM